MFLRFFFAMMRFKDTTVRLPPAPTTCCVLVRYYLSHSPSCYDDGAHDIFAYARTARPPRTISPSRHVYHIANDAVSIDTFSWRFDATDIAGIDIAIRYILITERDYYTPSAFSLPP